MVIHTIYSITLERASLLFETQNPRYLQRFGRMPRGYLRRQFDKFKIQFNQLFNEKETVRRVGDGLNLLKLTNRAYNLLPAIKKGILIVDDDAAFKAYERYFHTPCDGVDAYNRIDTEIERLKDKIKELQKTGEADGVAQFSLEKTVSSVENILGYSIDRRMKLYAFKHKYDQALMKAKEHEKQQTKRGRH